MKERLREVIRRVLLPHFPIVLKFVVTETDQPLYKMDSATGDISQVAQGTLFEVWYLIPVKEHNSKERDKLKRETETLFDMLNPTHDESVSVNIAVTGDGRFDDLL